MPYYAQIDQNNKCIAISQLKENNRPNLILLNNYAAELIGAIYDKENQIWKAQDNNLDNNPNEIIAHTIARTSLPQTEEVEIGPTQSDRIELEIENLKSQQNKILEKLNILLNIQGDV